ncbi:MAG: hypothetical protein NTU47_04215 [Ignavibacteriales bacterium]|nr:hypothetical protein [Ignavibacteriales bacterium]
MADKETAQRSGPGSTLVMTLAKFAVSIITPIALGYSSIPTSLVEKIIIGFLTYLFWTSIELLITLQKLFRLEKGLSDLQNIRNDFNVRLLNLRVHFEDLSTKFYKPVDLFQEHINRSIQDLEILCTDAVIKEELYVKDYHFDNADLLLSAMESDKEKVIRYVWVLESDSKFFDEKWKEYCKQIEKGAKRGSIKSVKALLVGPDGWLENHPMAKQLLGYYAHQKGFDYRYIALSTYEKWTRDQRLSEQYQDFGIYGTRYIYKTLQYAPITSGHFSKDQKTISEYTKFFENVWKCAEAKTLPKRALPRMTLEGLFQFDQEIDRQRTDARAARTP